MGGQDQASTLAAPDHDVRFLRLTIGVTGEDNGCRALAKWDRLDPGLMLALVGLDVRLIPFVIAP